VRDDRLFLEVPVASRYVVRILEHRLAPTGIPPYQLGLVTHIRHAQPVTPTEISAASGVPPTTLRDNIQRLVDGGLVRRVPHPTDGRSYRLELTSRGEVMARAADPVLAEAYAALDRLLPKPLDHYQETVEELNTALERALAELGEPLYRGDARYRDDDEGPARPAARGRDVGR
jgi:DNA-binding MarR family transcriptional regulator